MYMKAMIVLYLPYIIERVAMTKIISIIINGKEINTDRAIRDLD